MRCCHGRKRRWAAVEGQVNVEVHQLGERARVALALLRSADPDARALEELEVNFESSGYYAPGKFYGPPENCYPEEYEDEREITDVTLLLDTGQVQLADTLVRILASDPVLKAAMDAVELTEPEPDYDARYDAAFDR